MAKNSQTETISLRFGDEIEFYYRDPAKNAFVWGDRSVVAGVYPRSVAAFRVATKGGKEYLTTESTDYGPVRIIGKWTLRRIVDALAAGRGLTNRERTIAITDYALELHAPAEEYTFTWPEGSPELLKRQSK